MKKLTQLVTDTRSFLTEVKIELQKCTWPTRAELIESTVVVIISLLIIGIFVGLSDTVAVTLLGLLIR